MGDQFWESTAEMYSSLFEKPKMTQKLLSKPPFKYIFDIITATTQATGFGENLYSDPEKDPNYYQNKDQKIIYLRKIIDVTSLVLQQDIAARPSQIVAGLEPELTNLFLQAVYRAAVSGEDSQSIVQRMKDKYDKIIQQGGTVEDKDPAAPKQEPAPQKVVAEPPAKKPEDQQTQDPKQAAAAPPEKKPQEEPTPSAPTQQDAAPEQQPAPPEPKQDDPPKTKPVEKEPPKQKEPEPVVNQPPAQPKMERPVSSNKRPPVLQSNVTTDDKPKGGAATGTRGVILDNKDNNDDEDDHPAPSVASTQTSSSAAPAQGKEINAKQHGKFIQDALKDGGNDDKPSKQKVANNEQLDEGQDKQGGGIKMGKVKRGKKTNKDDKSGSGTGGGSSSGAGSGSGTGKGSSGESAGSGGIGVDVETLGNLVQAICQNANPLGKSLDFISDDIQSMNTEMKYWHDQYAKSQEKMAIELKQTDEALQPLQDQLAEIDEQIRDAQSQTQNVKSQIIKNQSQIQTLLYSVVASK